VRNTGTARADWDMAHIAIQEVLDGKTVDWLEAVTDDEFASVQTSG
jgi:hypothetical protein